MTCAFVTCAEAANCALVGGCVQLRFTAPAIADQRSLPKSKAHNGQKPSTKRPSK